MAHEHDGAIVCARCGRCCLTNLIAYATPADLTRWRAQGRQDIIDLVEHGTAVWAGDRIVSRADGRLLEGCPCLIWEGSHYGCSIYHTRPDVCRGFLPGSNQLCPQG